MAPLHVARTTRAEMETTLTYNRHGEPPVIEGCTADPAEARRWKRLGYPVDVLGRYPGGEPRTWTTVLPIRALGYRRMVDGTVPRRPGRRGATPPRRPGKSENSDVQS